MPSMTSSHRAPGFLNWPDFLYQMPTYLGFLVLALLSHSANAGIFGSLGSLRELTNETFEADLFLQAMTDTEGHDLEFINLDIVNSKINGAALTDFSRVTFQASTLDHDFASWQGTEQFNGTAGFESQISLDAFTVGSTKFTLPSTPFIVGTFTFDYSGLGLSIGDTVTLDVTGIDQGLGSKTTSVAVFDPTTSISTLIDPTFGPGVRTLTLTSGTGGGVIPEPSLGTIFLLGSIGAVVRRRRRAA